jgi:hypothetical protein
MNRSHAPNTSAHDRNVLAVDRTILGDLAVARERRSAECVQVDVEHCVPDDAVLLRHSLGRLELVLMSLAITEREGVHQEALLRGEREQGGGVEAAA